MATNLKIWYFSHYAGGPGIGNAMRAFHLGEAWLDLGHETTVFAARFHHLLQTGEPLPQEKMVGRVRYVFLPARRYKGNGIGRILNMADYCLSMLQLPKDIDRPDVIIVTSPHPFGIFSGWRLARKYRAKLVFEVRDIWPLSITEINGSSKWHPFVLMCALAERFAYRKADLASSLLGNAEEHMRRHGLPPGKFVHVPNGVDMKDADAPFPPSTDTGRQAAELLAGWRAEGRTIVIHPGSQGLPNAVDRLLEAAALLQERGQGHRFGVILIGGGSMTESLKAQAAKLALSNVAFFSTVPKAEAVWLTQASDIGYAGAKDHFSVYRYGISFNKIMDFMKAGIPVILPISAQGDPVTASGCGIVTGSDRPEDIAAALEKMLDQTPQALSAMGAKGRAYVDEVFEYRAIAAKYINAIEAIS